MRPSKLTHLAEHHYEEPAIDESTGEAATYGKRYVERIETSLSTFYNDPALEEARSVEPGRHPRLRGDVHVRAVRHQDLRRSGLRLSLARWRGRRLRLGRRAGPRRRTASQLAVYVEYAEAKWGVDPATGRLPQHLPRHRGARRAPHGRRRARADCGSASRARSPVCARSTSMPTSRLETRQTSLKSLQTPPRPGPARAATTASFAIESSPDDSLGRAPERRNGAEGARSHAGRSSSGCLVVLDVVYRSRVLDPEVRTTGAPRATGGQETPDLRLQESVTQTPWPLRLAPRGGSGLTSPRRLSAFFLVT